MCKSEKCEHELNSCSFLCRKDVQKIPWIIAFYRGVMSPMLHAGKTGGCRFYPSCSEYARMALERDPNRWRAWGRSVWRVMRCGPWSKGGVDFPPEYR